MQAIQELKKSSRRARHILYWFQMNSDVEKAVIRHVTCGKNIGQVKQNVGGTGTNDPMEQSRDRFYIKRKTLGTCLRL